MWSHNGERHPVCIWKLKKAWMQIGIALLTSISIIPSHAEETNLFDLTLEELMNVTVSVATKSDTRYALAPSSVTIFDRKKLDSLGIDTLVDLYDFIPGFYSMYNPVEGNQSYLVTRGHSQKYAANVLLLINGIRVNDDYTGGLSYVNRFLSLAFAERIEVIRGPGSALYGSNAFNGVINIITKPTKQIAVGLESYEGRNWTLGWRASKDDFSYHLGITGYQSEGANFTRIYDRFSLQDSTTDKKSNVHVDAKIKYQSTSMNLLHYESNREDFYVFRRLRDGVNQVELAQTLIGVNHDFINKNDQRLTTHLDYNSAERSSKGVLAIQDSTVFVEDDFLFGEAFQYESSRATLDYWQKLNNKFNFIAGGEWFRSQVPKGKLKSNYDFDANYLGGFMVIPGEDGLAVLDKTRDMVGLYSQLEYKFDEFSGVLGMRYDQYSDTQDKLSPRASLVYEHSEQHVFKAMYSESFRAPSLGDLYDKENGLTDGNANLQAPVLRSVELVHQMTSDSWSMATHLYQNAIDNLVGFASTASGGVALDNIAESTTQGLEWVGSIKWNRLSADLMFSHLFQIESDLANDSITHFEDLTPKNYGTLNLHYDILNHGVISTNFHFRDAVEVLDTDGGIVDVSVFYTTELIKNMTLKVSVDNLFDRAYDVGAAVPLNASGDPFYQQYPMRGRVVGAEVQYTF